MLQRRQLHCALLAAPFAALLAACDQAEQPGLQPIAADQAFDTVAAEGRGFSVGAITAARTVHVLFDPQCPHCSHLWQAALPLLGQARFVWLPVAFISPKSLPQGAALLQAANPLETMNAHEQSLLAGGGGMAASSSVPSEIEVAIQRNTKLLGRLGAESVPFIVARRGGQPVLHAGAMDTAGLRALLGLS